MATVIDRIQSFGDSLTPNEGKVAAFLQRDPEGVINSSIHEVAKRSGVSVASVSRLATTLGYRDWKELRLNLVKDLNRNAADAPVYSDISRKDTDESMIKKIFDCSMLSLKDTFEQIDKQKVIDVVAVMEKAPRVVFFGTGRSGFFSQEEAVRFAQLELVADAYTDEYQMILQSMRMSAGQIAFGFSNSGRSKATVAALAEAKRNRALTVGIANYRNTPLEKVSDIYFCTSFPRVGEISSSLTARIALLCIMDSIYVLACSRPKLAKRVSAAARSIDKSLRHAARNRNGGRSGHE